jgi:hypothetical protein
MKKLIFLILIFTFAASVLKADDFTDAMLKAKKNLNSAMAGYQEKDLLKVRGEFERILQLKKNEWIVNYYLAVCDYFLSFSSMGKGTTDNDKIKKYTESGLDIIGKSISLKDDFADSYVIMLGLSFNRWVYESSKMTDIIAQSTEAQKKAEELEPLNPRLNLMKGQSAYYTPANFGGGYDAAVKDLEKSLESFSTRVEKEAYYPDWGKDLTYGYLSLAYKKRNDDGDDAKSKTTYENGLKEFPDSGFLKFYIKNNL